MKRKRLELTDEIVRAARALVVEWRRTDGNAQTEYDAGAAICAAVDALDAYGPSEIVGGTGAFNPGSDTSEAAAVRIAEFSGVIRRLVVGEVSLGQWQANGTLRGLTCDEIELRLKRPHTSVSSAVNWLSHAGWLMDSGYRRETRAGRDAIVWCLTPAALAKRGERA